MKLRIPFTMFGELGWFSPIDKDHVIFKLPRWKEPSEPVTFEDFVDTFGECPAAGCLVIKDFFTTNKTT